MTAVGPYELREPIGEGGMAQVFRALGPEGEVAIKVLRGGADASEEALARFERESKVAEGLEHPHLIRVLDHGVDEAMGPWLAMPLVRGMTLRDLFTSERICPEAALVLLYPLVDALAALHTRELVHRDVKPENLMLSPMGDVTLVDLGLALSETDTRHTREGEVAGSVPYMSPERIDGRDVDASADVWAVGVMLYELIASKRPFERARASEEVAAILGGTFTALGDVDRRVSKELDWLVSTCLAPDPWKRPRDAGALLERLRPMIFGELDRAREARVSVLSDVAGYERRLAPKVAAEAREAAEARLQDGDTFEALRLLDRALAYAPDDEATLTLVEAAASGEVPARAAVDTADTSVAKPPKRRTGLLAAIAVVALGLAGAGIFFATRPADPAPPIAVATHGEPVAEDAAVETAELEDAGVPRGRPLEFHPIPPDVLSNDDPPDLEGLTPGPDESLVSRAAVGRDPERARGEAVRALEDDPDDIEQLTRRAMATLALGRTDEGLRELDALGREHGDEPAVLAALGFVSTRRGHFEEADAQLTRALETDPDSQPALRHRGILRRRMGRTRDGYHDLVRLLALDPDNIFALGEMTEVYERAQRPLDAEPFLTRLVELYPTNAEAWASLSIVLSASRDDDAIERAVSAVERALSLNADNVRAHRQRCTLFSQHQRAGAAAACTEAILRAPRDPGLFGARAVALARRGQHVPALADADRAVELAPETPRHYANRAILRGGSGNEQGAYADLRVACSLGDTRSCDRLRMDGLSP